MMLIELLLLFIFVILIAAVYFFYDKYTTVTKAMANFKPVQNIIGKVPQFSQNMEDFMSSNKEFLEAMITYLDHRMALTNEKLHDRSITQDQIQFILGQCDTYISIRGSMVVLLERKKKNDN